MAETSEPTKQVTKETRKLENKETRIQKHVENTAAEAKGFDLNLPTQKSHTFSFTFEELFALQEVLTGLQRLLGLDPRITKIDIIRSALQIIVEDYRKRGEESFIVERIKTKKPVDHIRTKKVR
jgi:hypothetical protein